jgi:hypothetical protein
MTWALVMVLNRWGRKHNSFQGISWEKSGARSLVPECVSFPVSNSYLLLLSPSHCLSLLPYFFPIGMFMLFAVGRDIFLSGMRTLSLLVAKICCKANFCQILSFHLSWGL